MIVASRELRIAIGNGASVPVAVVVEAPVADGPGWVCSYQIDWPAAELSAETTRSRGGGADAMQALLHALQRIGLDLHMSHYHRTGTMYWIEGRVGYGFPVPPGARDLLRGDDVTLFG